MTFQSNVTINFHNYFGWYWPTLIKIKRYNNRQYWNDTPQLHKEIVIIFLWWYFSFIRTTEGMSGQSVFDLV